jgi:SpoIIAA-like
MIEPISALPENVVGFVAEGDVTAEDYEQRLVPAIERALASHDKIRLLYVLGSDFTGYSGRAIWDDGKVGMQHLTRWERIAVVSDQQWIRHSVNVFGYLIPGEVKAFELADQDAATAWVTA